jgi:hypothetical protein
VVFEFFGDGPGKYDALVPIGGDIGVTTTVARPLGKRAHRLYANESKYYQQIFFPACRSARRLKKGAQLVAHLVNSFSGRCKTMLAPAPATRSF